VSSRKRHRQINAQHKSARVDDGVFLMGFLPSFLRMLFVALCVLGLGVLTPETASAQTGAEVRNTATITYQQGPTVLTVPTNEVVFVIEGARTSSTIEFFRFTENTETGILSR